MIQTINPPIHPYAHMSLQIINLQIDLNYLNEFKLYLIFSDLTRPHPLTHQSTQPSLHPPINSSVSTNHKSSNIELSQ